MEVLIWQASYYNYITVSTIEQDIYHNRLFNISNTHIWEYEWLWWKWRYRGDMQQKSIGTNFDKDTQLF